VVLLPYAFTRWQPGTSPWPVVVRVIGMVGPFLAEWVS
jgi:hypothetical protein